MKKIILIVVAVTFTSVGVGFAMNSMRQIEDHGKAEAGTKCFACKGTGWNGSFKCNHCGGTGANSAY